MKNSILILTIGLLSSCISSKKLDGFIHNYYAENPVTHPANSKNWYELKPSLAEVDTFSHSIRTTAQFIPAILYWQWHTNVNAALNKQIAVNRFNNYLSSKSEVTNLPNILGENKMELSFDSIPGSFSYIHKGNAIILLVATATTDLIAIQPENKPYVLSYSLTDKDGQQIATGRVSTENLETPMRNTWKSAKKFTWIYLDAYHKYQDVAFENLLIKLENEVSKKLLQPTVKNSSGI